MRLFIWIFTIISSLVFLAHYFVIGQAVYGDGRFYYSYARSLAVGGDLDIKDELIHIFSPVFNNSNKDAELSFTAYPVQSLGPALFWTPAVFTANIFARSSGLAANGYSDIYQIATGLFSIMLTAFAFSRLGNYLSKKYKTETVFFTLFLTWAATNLFFYTAIDNINTHFFSFALAAFALIEYLDKKNPSVLLTGFLAGLAFQNRQMDILFHLSLFTAFIFQNRKFKYLLKYGFAALLAVLPQLFVWHLQFGSVLPPLSENSYWNFNPGSLVSVLVGIPNGLLFTAPIMFLAGMYLFGMLKNAYIKFASISFLLTLLLLGFWFSPTGGASYGQRFLIVFFPLFTLSLAGLISKVSRLKMVFFSLLLVGLNLAHTLIFLIVSP